MEVATPIIQQIENAMTIRIIKAYWLLLAEEFSLL